MHRLSPSHLLESSGLITFDSISLTPCAPTESITTSPQAYLPTSITRPSPLQAIFLSCPSHTLIPQISSALFSTHDNWFLAATPFQGVPSFHPLSSTEQGKMSEEWENVTRIGQKHGGKGAGGGPRPVVVKGKTALNAAFRTGGVSTQKRTGTANSVCGPSMSKPNFLEEWLLISSLRKQIQKARGRGRLTKQTAQWQFRRMTAQSLIPLNSG
jgi:hypothetical protein